MNTPSNSGNFNSGNFNSGNFNSGNATSGPAGSGNTGSGSSSSGSSRAQPASPLPASTLPQGALDEVRRRRIIAFCGDFVAIMVLCSIAAIIIAFLGVITFGLGWILFSVFVPAIAFAYAGFTLGGPKQATPGMRMFDIHIVRNDGKPVDFWMALLYVAIFWFSFVTLLILLVSLFTPKKELLQDLLMGTYVVRTSATPQPPVPAPAFG